MHPHDADARITKMKDGRTRLAHKLKQAIDMESEAVVGTTVQTMDGGDTASLPNTLDEAQRELAELGAEPREVVADKGYHSNKTMTEIEGRGLRSYVSEPNRGRRNWKRNPAARKPTYANRRRIRGNRGQRLLRQRGEKLERTFAHLLMSGELRRVHVRGQEEIRKWLLIQAATFNLGLLMSRRFGFGTPRALQGLAAAQGALAGHASTAFLRVIRHFRRPIRLFRPLPGSLRCKTRGLHKLPTVWRPLPFRHPALAEPFLPRPASLPRCYAEIIRTATAECCSSAGAPSRGGAR